MSSTFFGLHIAASGLRAANAALNTTANNISNVNTAGYSRQEVKQEANDPLRVFATYGCAGAGVNTIAIERIRESFYDTKFRDNETKLGEYDTKAYYCKMLEEYLKSDKVPDLERFFDEEDWDDYRILAHALKSTSLTIGAVHLSGEAKALELAAKKGDADYIRSHHKAVMEEYMGLTDQLRKIIL